MNDPRPATGSPSAEASTGPTSEGTLASPCPSCGEPPVVPSSRFCEACGTTLATSATTQAGAGPPDGNATTLGAASGVGAGGPTAPRACDNCGGGVADDGYCTRCGVRAREPVTVEDCGAFASATHRGLRHPRNEDAAALATTGEGWPVLVVADGVSLSPNPHLAAAAAVAAAARELAGRPFTGPDDLTRAVASAHAAAGDIPADGDPHWPDRLAQDARPACTIVVAVVADENLQVANVGDARAYVLTPTDGLWGAHQLTTDDSVAALAVREGVEPAMALALPGGHAITAWLGGDGPVPSPHLAVHRSSPGDLLLACSDGLWNYAPSEDGLSRLVNALVPAPPEPPPGAALLGEELVRWAIDRGGSDNISVALAPVGRATPDGGGAETVDPADANSRTDHGEGRS